MTHPPDHPRRRDDVLSAALGDGELLFDPRRLRAHVLNGSADAVWQRCDGDRSVTDIVASFRADDPDIDLLAEVGGVIEHLRREGLLDDDGQGDDGEHGAPLEQAIANRFENVPHTAEPAPAHDEAGWHHSQVFRGLDFRFDVATDDRGLGRYLDAALAPLVDVADAARTTPAARRSSYTVVLGDGTAPWIVALDGFVVGRGDDPSAAAALVLWHVNQMVSTTSVDLLQLHASAISADGITVALPASMNSGKSTLVTALVGAGFAYVTDETVGVEPETLLVHPYPKAIALDPGSWPLFPHHEQLGRAGEQRFAHHKWHLDPVAIGGALAEPAPLGLIVLPRYTPGAVATPERLDATRAAVELAQNSFNLVTLGQRGVDAIARLAQDVPCYRLAFDDLDDAIAVITDLIGSRRASRQPH